MSKLKQETMIEQQRKERIDLLASLLYLHLMRLRYMMRYSSMNLATLEDKKRVDGESKLWDKVRKGIRLV
jgi:hypothetical protein